VPKAKKEPKIETRYYLSYLHPRFHERWWAGFTRNYTVAHYWENGKDLDCYGGQRRIHRVQGGGGGVSFLNHEEVSAVGQWGPSTECYFLNGSLWLPKEQKFWR
jgi:hypothetical protein